MDLMLIEGTPYQFEDDGQSIMLSWFPPSTVPDGKRSGSAGLCETDDGMIVLISEHGTDWSLPGGRPEGDETWEETLRREVWEEGCATITTARLLGFCRSHCIAGKDAGLTLVRSFWHARVTLDAWEPQWEINHRTLVTPANVMHSLTPTYEPLTRRLLREAGLG